MSHLHSIEGVNAASNTRTTDKFETPEQDFDIAQNFWPPDLCGKASNVSIVAWRLASAGRYCPLDRAKVGRLYQSTDGSIYLRLWN